MTTTAADFAQQSAEQNWFFHVRMLIGIIVGLALARVLTGLASAIRALPRVDPIHVGWAIYVFFYIAAFWWFEFSLSHTKEWAYELYLFVIFYASYLFILATTLFPDHGFDEHAIRTRRRLFYSLLSGLYIIDVADTAIKGMEHFNDQGSLYLGSQAALAALSIVAVSIRNRAYQAVLLFTASATLVISMFTLFKYID